MALEAGDSLSGGSGVDLEGVGVKTVKFFGERGGLGVAVGEEAFDLGLFSSQGGRGRVFVYEGRVKGLVES